MNNLEFLNKIVEQVKLVNPNYICIPGDFIDQRTIEDEENFEPNISYFYCKNLCDFRNSCEYQEN